MLLIVGILIVFGSVIGGFMMAGGSVVLLWQPSEYVVILGCAVGATIISSPLSTIKAIVHGLIAIFKGDPYTKQEYLNLLKMLFDFFNTATHDGLIGIEQHMEEPEKSTIFKKNPFFLAYHEALYYMLDTIRLLMAGAGGIPPHDLEALLDQDLEVMYEEALHPSNLLGKIAESLPGLGIVAAVLGIIITMQSIGGSAEAVGKHVAAALVGTFLGILACYGFVQPLAAYLETAKKAGISYIECVKAAMLAYHKGIPPTLIVEFARRAIPTEVRPTFAEAEQAIRDVKKAGHS